MAITATFYNFSKKKNSTKRPTGGTNRSIYLKDPCSVLNPVIELSSSSPVNFNYCYISTFGRYYFISDWISDHGLWRANCTLDPLASWRGTILDSTQFVLRSASEVNSFIEDTIYPVTSNSDISSKHLPAGTVGNIFNMSNAHYVLAVSNSDNVGKINGVQYLYCSQSDINQILAEVLNDNSSYWGTGSVEAGFGITNAVMRSIVNPLSYIGSAYMLPFSIASTHLTPVSSLKVGSWNLPFTGSLSAIKDTNYVYSETYDLVLDQHPQCYGTGAFHGTYLNNYPYSQYFIYAGPFGIIRLDNSVLMDTYLLNDVKMNIACDYKGKAVCTIYRNSDGSIIAKAYADVAVPITLTQSKNDILEYVGTASGGIGAASSLNPASIIANSANMASSIDKILPKTEVTGYAGSNVQVFEEWRLQEEFHLISTNDESAVNILGKPLMEMRQISDLSGYCQCADVWLDIEGYDSEYDMITSLMQSGFYIE